MLYSAAGCDDEVKVEVVKIKVRVVLCSGWPSVLYWLELFSLVSLVG